LPEAQEAETPPTTPPRPTGILAQIVETKREEIASLRPLRGEWRSRARDAEPARDFGGALARPDRVSLIAEVKRRSPGAGAIRPDLDPIRLASTYEEAGASAVSVLTDREYFGGSIGDLVAIRSHVGIPLLRKDFLLSEEQLWEARASGADAILLIVSILEDSLLTELRLQAEEWGMTALVEVHDAGELDRALRSGAQVIGINNRDLRSFQTTLETTFGLLDRIPSGALVVSESGIRTVEEVHRLGTSGVDAILVGETLLRSAHPEAEVRALSGVPREGGLGGRP